jgi:hypothetical protein
VIQKGAKTKAIEPGIGEQNQAQTMLPEVNSEQIPSAIQPASRLLGKPIRNLIARIFDFGCQID